MMDHCPECGCELVNPKEHSDPMRRMFFASIREIWKNLPDNLRETYPSEEALRKAALIHTGWADNIFVVYDTPGEASAARNVHQRYDRYCVVEVSDSILKLTVARSMKKRACPKKQFHDVADKALTWASALIDTTPDQIASVA